MRYRLLLFSASIFFSLLFSSCESNGERLHSLIVKDSTVSAEKKTFADSLDNILRKSEMQLMDPGVYRDSTILKKTKGRFDKLLAISQVQRELSKYLDDVKWQVLKYSNTVTIKIEGTVPALNRISKNKRSEELIHLFEGEGLWSAKEILEKMKRGKSKLADIMGEDHKADFEKLSSDYLKGYDRDQWKENFTKTPGETFLFLTELQKEICMLCYKTSSALANLN